MGNWIGPGGMALAAIVYLIDYAGLMPLRRRTAERVNGAVAAMFIVVCAWVPSAGMWAIAEFSAWKTREIQNMVNDIHIGPGMSTTTTSAEDAQGVQP